MIILLLTYFAFVAFAKRQLASTCASTEVQIGSQCADCTQLLGIGCNTCSQTLEGYYQCDSCTDGFYLLKTSTSTPGKFVKLCLKDCWSFSYQFVANPNNNVCEFCGNGCAHCSAQLGCVDSLVIDHGYRKGIYNHPDYFDELYSSSAPSPSFGTQELCEDPRCDKCQEYNNVMEGYWVTDYPICDSCYMYVNEYPLEKQAIRNCSLCFTSQANCLTCDPDRPDVCAGCQKGYYLLKEEIQTFGSYEIQTECLPCSSLPQNCLRCDETGCLECEKGYALSNNVCVKCDLTQFNSEYTYLPNRCSMCTSSSATECAYCDIGYFGTSANPTKCMLTCDVGQYPSIQFHIVNMNENIPLHTQCMQCHSSCSSCSGPTEFDCLTCASKEHYLQIGIVGDVVKQSGLCKERIINCESYYSYRGYPIELFVMNQPPNWDSDLYLKEQSIGDIDNPFWDLKYALVKAKELASICKEDVEVVIYLFRGEHYWIRDHQNTLLIYYPNQYGFSDNLNIKLTIKPLPCDYQGANVQGICTDDKVTIYNKGKEDFYIEVGVSLTLQNIVIDSLDSILYSGITLAGYEHSNFANCLQQRRQCCQVVDGSVTTQAWLGSTICEEALAEYQKSQEVQCLVNQPRAMFEMKLNQREEVKTSNKVVIDNVEIRNTIYAMNAIVQLSPIWGQVEISESVFSNLNICGAIVKSYFYELETPFLLTNVDNSLISDEYRLFMEEELIKGPKQDFHQNPAQQQCNSDCYLITITSSLFDNLQFESQSISEYVFVAKENGMRNRGLIIDINNIDISLEITNSQFTNTVTYFSVADPTMPLYKESLNNLDQMFNSDKVFNKIQLMSLISAQSITGGSIALKENDFENNGIISSLVRIDAVNTITNIQQNTFIQSGSALGYSVLEVRQCDSLTIQENEFQLTSGLQEAGVVQIQCVTGSSHFVFNERLDTYSIKDYAEPLQGSSIDFIQNNFIGNYAGKDKHICSIEGFQKVKVQDCTFKNNENFLPQIFNKISPFSAQLSQERVITLDNCSYKAQAILRVAGGSEISISDSTFMNNWINDAQSSKGDAQSNGILIQDCRDSLSLTNLDFIENKGAKGSKYAQLYEQGFRSQLITFKLVSLQTLTLQSLNFAQNQMKFNDNAFSYGAMQPRLFVLNSLIKDGVVNVNNLSLEGNSLEQGQSMLYFHCKTISLSNFSTQGNQGTNIVNFDIEDEESKIIIEGGEHQGNSLTNGAIFIIREGVDSQINIAAHSSHEFTPDKDEPKENEFHIKFNNVKFIATKSTGPQSKTSCIEFIKQQDLTYPWLNVKFSKTTFSENDGGISGAIQNEDSMVLWLIFEKIKVFAPISLSSSRIASFLYTKSEFGLMRVSDSLFECGNTYDKQLIMNYFKEDCERAGFFRINGNTLEHLPPLELNNTLKNSSGVYLNGTLNMTSMRNRFYGNTFQKCNQINQGSVFYLEGGARVYDYQSKYYKLSALEGGVAYLDGIGTYLQIEFAQSIQTIYAYYGGVAYAINGATAHIMNKTEGVFIESFEGSIAYLTQRARLVMNNRVTFTSVYSHKGAAIFASNGAQFATNDVDLINIKAGKANAIIAIENGRAPYHLENGQIRTPYGFSYYLRSYLNNTKIERSSVEQEDRTRRLKEAEGRLITINEGALFMNRSMIHQTNEILVDNYGIVVLSGEVQIFDSNITGRQNMGVFRRIPTRDLEEIYGAFVAAYGFSKVEIVRSNLTNARATNGGCVGLFGSTIAFIDDSEFTNCYAYLGGAIYADSFDQIRVWRSRFKDNYAYQGYGQNIYAAHGTDMFHLELNQFYSYVNSVYYSSTRAIIKSCEFFGSDFTIKEIGRQKGGGLYIQNTLNTEIRNCTFVQLWSLDGGAIYYSQETDSWIEALEQKNSSINRMFSITKNNFTQCYAQYNGGSLYLRDIRGGQIQSNLFKDSMAGEIGGAIYFWCQPTSIEYQKNFGTNCGLDFKIINTFQNSTAQIGGGLYWNFIEPYIQSDQKGMYEQLSKVQSDVYNYKSLVFKSCKAAKFGPQIAAPAREIVRIDNQTFQSYYNQNDKRRQDVLQPALRMNVSEKEPCLTFYSYESVQSGGNVPYTWFALIDKYGQVVQTNSGQQIQFRLESEKEKEGETFRTDILGMQDFYSMFGLYEMYHMGILSRPDIMIDVSVTVNAIDLRVPSTNQYLSQYFNDGKPMTKNSQYRIPILMQVSSCRLGEGLKPTGACFTCPKGTFLLEIPTEPTECAVCQIEKSICLGGSDIGPLPGYWRKSISTYVFLPCKISSSCLGKDPLLPIDEPGNAVGLCNVEQGYYGVLCSACLPGFKRQETYKCSKCQTSELYFTLVAYFFVIIGLSMLINMIISGAASANNTHSVFNKILMNHMQMLLITASFDMNWPQDVVQIFDIAAPVRQITDSIVSFDCLIEDRKIEDVDPYNFYADAEEFRIVYKKALIMGLLPILIVIICYCSWYIVLWYKRKLMEHQTYFVASVVFLLFLVHPSITQSMVSFFNCQDLDGELRLVVDLQITCWTGMHQKFTLFIALPCLIIWGIGIPWIVYKLMSKESDYLETVAVKQKFGFLYNGYKRNNYYWEIVIMYRKILCIFVAVFLNRIGIIVQALVLLIVLVVFWQANGTNRPFTERSLNDIEALSLATQVATIYCGVFFISAKDPNSSNFDKNRDFEMTDQYRMFLFFVITFCNAAFLLLWFTKFMNVIKVLIKDKYPYIYVIIFLCGRKDKMAFENSKRARDKKKEAIIESIEAVTLMMNKMKSMYINNVYFQDHKRFIKLLYTIESERLQIDLTEKRNNYYIQGTMSRVRKFDPETVKEAQDKAIIQIDGDFLNSQTKKQQTKLQRVGKQLTSLNKLQPKMRQSSQFDLSVDQGSLGGRSFDRDQTQLSMLRSRHDDSPQIFDDDIEGQEEMERKKKKNVDQKPKVKKANKQDLRAMYLNSRNALFNLKTQRESRLRLQDLDPNNEFKIKEKVLPEYLQNFEKIQGSSLGFHDSEDEKRFTKAMLTNRKDESPVKQSPIKKKNLTDSMTEIDGDLQPYNIDTDANTMLRSQGNKSVVVESIGQDERESILLKPEDQAVKIERKRPNDGYRNQYVGGAQGGIMQIDLAIDYSFDEQLQVTLIDEDGQLVAPPDPQKLKPSKQSEKKEEEKDAQPKDTIVFTKSKKQRRHQDGGASDSFGTDPSMKDMSINEPESPPKQSELLSNRQNSKKQPQIGDGLGVIEPFHPPQANMFDQESKSLHEDQIEDNLPSERSQRSQQSSRRVMVPPITTEHKLLEQTKSRNENL